MADPRTLLARLPSLYRPEPDDGTLLAAFLGAVAAEVEQARTETSMVLSAHWFRHADRAALDPWFTRRREVVPLPPLAPADLLDYADARRFLTALKDGHTPLAQHLRSELPEPARAALAAWDPLAPAPVALQRRVLDGLHRTVRGALLYQPELFADITLPPELQAQVADEVAPASRPAVNVSLLLAAFPAQLRRAQLDLPRVSDLGRLGGLVPLVPWREPPALQESAEAYRLRLARMVALFRHGLGTRAALRAVVEATLPVRLGFAPELRDPPFTIEEYAPLVTERAVAPTSGPPDDVVGPLMRWTLENAGLGSAPATLLITGIEPGGGNAPTIDPVIELQHGPGMDARTGIGYRGTIPAGQTLRLRPAYTSWLLAATGLSLAPHPLHPDTGADPVSPGAATAVAGAPTGITALFASSDGMFWAGAAGSTLARFDGSAWTEMANGLPAIRCLAEHAGTLLLGTASGLLRRPLQLAAGDPLAPTVVAGFEGVAVRVLTRAPGTGFWVGTDTGALWWDGNAAPEPVSLGGDVAISTAVHDIQADGDRAVHFGCELGVFEYQPAAAAWFWYGGGSFSEQAPEWEPFRAGPQGAPADGTVFLPAVLAVRRGPDAALWFGTTHGIARYLAHEVNGHSYTTLLEAFPDLGTGPVTQIREDERGGLWFTTDRGLLRFDGRDWWQRQNDGWVHLGRSDVLPGATARPRGGWRFVRGIDQWQRFEPASGGWIAAPVPLRTTAEPAVARVLVSDRVEADLGTLTADGFAPASSVDPAQLVLRIKPAEDRIVSGGIPVIPRVPPGRSTWRYLRLEPADLEEPDADVRPAWSWEGRLFPPPPELSSPYSGRFNGEVPHEGNFDQAVFAYPPAARVRFDYSPTQPCSVLVRLHQPAGGPACDPAVIDRVWEGMQLVRPAGIRTLLALNETTVRGS